MKRLPASGSVIVTGPASRSNTVQHHAARRRAKLRAERVIGSRRPPGDAVGARGEVPVMVC
jgi:hypothetical protein